MKHYKTLELKLSTKTYFVIIKLFIIDMSCILYFIFADSDYSDMDSVPIHIKPVNLDRNKTNSGDPINIPNNSSVQK